MNYGITSCHIAKDGKVIQIAKAVLVIFCLVGFGMNSYFIFVDYIEGSTIISTDLQHAENGVVTSPSILICGKMSFEKTELNPNVADYIENSLKLDEFLRFAMLVDGDLAHPVAKNVTDQFRSFYTVYFGTCHMLDLNVMVRFTFVYLTRHEYSLELKGCSNASCYNTKGVFYNF